MRSFSKFLCIFLSLIILCGTLSAGIYATADSEDTGRYSDSSIGTPIEPTRDAHLHFYFANAKDGDLLSYNWSNLCETRYSSGNGNSHYYQQWELYYYNSGNYNVVLPFGGDRPYALSVNPSTNVVSIESIDDTDPCQHWARILKPDGIALVSKATGTAAYGKALYINGSSFTVNDTEWTAFFEFDYTDWTEPTSIPCYDFYLAPGQTRAISPSPGFNPRLIKLSSSVNGVLTINRNSATGTTPGQTTLTITDMMTDLTKRVSVTVTEIPNGTYFLKNKQTQCYAKVLNGAMNENTAIVQYEFDGSAYERWQFTLDMFSGYYSIKSLGSSSSYYMTVHGSTSTLEENIVLGTSPDDNGAKWRVSRSTSGAYIITPKTGENAGGNGVDYVLSTNTSYGYNNRPLVQSDYLLNTSYRDEWYIMMMPTNGCELDYDPDLWDDDVERGCNCYAYAINNQVLPGTNYIWFMQQPKEYHDLFSDMDVDERYLTYEQKIFRRVKLDFETYNTVNGTSLLFIPIERDDICPAGTYKVALVVNADSYHWYRQDSDGLWSHKPGTTPVRRTDDVGSLIFDPETCAHDLYQTFGGYYAVTPWNNIFDESMEPLYYYDGEVFTYNDLIIYLIYESLMG